MKRAAYSDSKILTILKQAQGVIPITSLCREHGMSKSTFYKWCDKYDGMDASLMSRMKELELKNSRLKKMYAEVQLQNEAIHEAMVKNGEAVFSS